MSRRASAAILAAASLLAPPAEAFAQFKPPSRLTVVTEINFPPYLFPAEGGMVSGIVKDKWDLWSARTGIPVTVVGMEWKLAQEAVQSGRIDVIEALSYTEARSKLYEYSPPYAPIEARVYFHSSITGINDAASLRGFRVGAKEGSACGNWLAARGVKDIEPYPDSEALVRAAGRGDVRLFCMDAPAAQYFLFKLGLDGEFRQTAPLYVTQFHWAVVKGRAELRDFIQSGFASIPPRDLNAVDERWLGNPLRFSVASKYVSYVAFGVLGFLVLAALLLLWNRTLHRQVRAATRELALVADSVPVMLVHWDRDMRCRWANASYAAYYGRTPAQMTGMHMRELIGAEFLERVRTNFERVLAGETVSYEASPPGEGRRAVFHVQLVPERSADGVVNGWFGVLLDVTARHQAERELRDSEARFSAIFHDSPAPLAVVALDEGLIRDVNQAWTALWGYAREQVVGRHVTEVLRVDDPKMRTDVYRGLVEVGQVNRREFTAASARGEARIALVSGRVVTLNGERSVLWSYMDVTELRRAQREIEALNETLEATVQRRTAELRRANDELVGALENLKTSQDALLQSEKLAALGRLVAGVAHELNTPIGNALLTASTVNEHAEEFARQAQAGLRRSVLESFVSGTLQASQILLRNLAKAAELIRSFKQISADQSSSQRRDFSLREVVDEVLLAHHPVLKKTAVTVQNDVPDGIRLDSYPGPLGQVLGNLVTNAVLHGYDGRSPGKVLISARLDRNEIVEIAVRDDGCGISEANLKRVFDPFFTTRMGRGGTGLGLSICHRIVTESLGGTVRVASRYGEGTSFMVRIPLKAPALAVQEAA
jgi:PAS domain S-box-containing protein